MSKGKQAIIGVIILIVIIGIIIGMTILKKGSNYALLGSNLTEVFVATGGGKENFIADKDVIKIMAKEYNIKVVYDSWSNGKMIKNPLVRTDGSKYDAMFCSDQRFYDYFQISANKEKGEADRDKVLDGDLTLNTPIVIYSWDTVVDVLMAQNIVEVIDGIYYITDMNKLISYIIDGTKWSDIGLKSLYGSINIGCTDPVTSSPGATYYGLLLSIMSEGAVTEEKLRSFLPDLKNYYIKSGYMNTAPADLFDKFLKTGVGAEPMIVDYEKSVIDFANSNPDGWNQVKDQIRILYPTPTIWNSHCIATFNENGNRFLEAFTNKEIQQIAWTKYGFRTGTTGGNYDVSKVNVSGIPQSITSTVSGLKINMYDEMIEYLSSDE